MPPSSASPLELGLYTFGDRVADPKTGRTPSAHERMRDMLAMAKLADEAGLDILGVGEHHALRYVNSATATIIAAMATITKRIRFTSASTSISTADPVRTFQEFATADLASDGRVEIVFGRGAFTDNFPLFGLSLDDYDALFVEKVALFAELNAHERVTSSGQFRPALHDAEVAPRPAQAKLPVWIGAGSPDSVVRAALLGYPLAIPVLGGSLGGYTRIVALYRHAWEQSGRPRDEARVAMFSHLHVTETAKETRDDFFPYYSAYLEPLFKGPMPRPTYHQMLAPEGSLVGGSVDEVVDKILAHHEALGMCRYLGQIDIGGQSFSDVAKGIELFATRVAPSERLDRSRAPSPTG
jgi:alkanesulfonate monooxygenase SsuD/methylene tetrahydromethanopterin reductase-like flavin-dependent oxidoreductase (luciferase family)